MKLSYEEIKYRPKYRLTAPHQERLQCVKFLPTSEVHVEVEERKIQLDGFQRATILTLHEGYEWDGASGPTFDSENSQRASAVHDALYDLIARGILAEHARKGADKEFLRILKEDGMSYLRRRAWYRAVRRFGASHAQ